MCVSLCIGFTGPYTYLESSPHCGEPHYNQKELKESGSLQKVPRNVFITFPVGPQLQACWKNLQTVKDMFYRWDKTQELLQERAETSAPPGVFDDILCDSYLDLLDNGKINKYNTVLMMSIDNAQLSESKKSDVWIYIWILFVRGTAWYSLATRGLVKGGGVGGGVGRMFHCNSYSDG